MTACKVVALGPRLLALTDVERDLLLVVLLRPQNIPALLTRAALPAAGGSGIREPICVVRA